MKADFCNLFCICWMSSTIFPPSPIHICGSSLWDLWLFQASPVSSSRCSPHSSPWVRCSLQHWPLNTPGYSCPLSSFFSAYPATWKTSACIVAAVDLQKLFLLLLIRALILISLLLSLWFSFLEINLCNSKPLSSLVEAGWLSEGETERKQLKKRVLLFLNSLQILFEIFLVCTFMSWSGSGMFFSIFLSQANIY